MTESPYHDAPEVVWCPRCGKDMWRGPYDRPMVCEHCAKAVLDEARLASGIGGSGESRTTEEAET